LAIRKVDCFIGSSLAHKRNALAAPASSKRQLGSSIRRRRSKVLHSPEHRRSALTEPGRIRLVPEGRKRSADGSHQVADTPPFDVALPGDPTSRQVRHLGVGAFLGSAQFGGKRATDLYPVLIGSTGGKEMVRADIIALNLVTIRVEKDYQIPEMERKRLRTEILD
jgi:hypothetical protein